MVYLLLLCLVKGILQIANVQKISHLACFSQNPMNYTSTSALNLRSKRTALLDFKKLRTCVIVPAGRC